MSPPGNHYVLGVGSEQKERKLTDDGYADGYTYEYWLTMNERRINGTEIYRTVAVGDSLDVHAYLALKDIIKREGQV